MEIIAYNQNDKRSVRISNFLFTLINLKRGTLEVSFHPGNKDDEDHDNDDMLMVIITMMTVVKYFLKKKK